MRPQYLLLGIFIECVLANTEIIQFRLPSLEYPECQRSDYPVSHHMSLKNKNYAKETFEMSLFDTNNPAQSSNVVNIYGLEREEAYAVKICWSALNPVSVDHEILTSIVSDSEMKDKKGSKCYRDYLQVILKNDSYPFMKVDSTVAINVTVVSTKLGIPVDLLGTLIYITTIVVCIGILDRKINLYRMLVG